MLAACSLLDARREKRLGWLTARESDAGAWDSVATGAFPLDGDAQNQPIVTFE